MRRRLSLLVIIFVLTSVLFYGQSELLGPLTPDEIFGTHPDWQDVVTGYVPAEQAIQKLKDINIQVHVEVFLGTWCSDSKTQVSAFFKVLDAIDSPLITASYIGLPKDKAARQPYIQGRDIQRLPTFIVSVDGQEVGRIIETPVKSVEQDLLGILAR
jgi:hypothetical protein